MADSNRTSPAPGAPLPASACAGVTAIVTGASRGLGREIARALAAAGASVVLVARSAEDLDATRRRVEPHLAPGAHVRACPIDLSSDGAADRLARQLEQDGLEPDALVNNAAVQGPVGPFWKNDWREWVDSFHLNAFSPLLLTRAFLPGMIRRGWGKVVFLSGGGATGPRPRFTAYGAAKTLLVRFSETLSAELAGTGVEANAVAPGAMKSAMTDAILAAGPGNAGEKEYAAARKLAQGTEAVVSRAAALCVFLCSHRSDGISGRLISAAWDPWEALPEHREELAGSDVYALRRIVPKDRGMGWGEPR
ncbi:MAG TPA: SDR family oxidoreductase [Spirochaetia bacterium]|nr:SDR family oxidoreductase [Spirochaetia bacterium]